MKMFVCFTILIAIIFPIYNSPKTNIFEIEGISAVYFAEEENGNFNYIQQDINSIKIDNLSKSDAILLVFEEKSVDFVIKNLKIDVFKQEFLQEEELEIVYGYTNFYNDFIYIDGKQSNAQVVKSGEKILVGFPIIYCGYWCIKIKKDGNKELRRFYGKQNKRKIYAIF